MPTAWSVFSLRMASSAFVYFVAAKMSSNFFFSTAPSASGLRPRARSGVSALSSARARSFTHARAHTHTPVGVVLVHKDDVLQDGLPKHKRESARMCTRQRITNSPDTHARAHAAKHAQRPRCGGSACAPWIRP
jgi:hypothetical protein